MQRLRQHATQVVTLRRIYPVCVAALAAAVLAAPASGAGGNTVVARFKWSVTGSMTHTWNIAGSDPCQPAGGGTVKATFSGSGRGAFKVERNQYGTVYNYDPQISLHGKITELDNTAQNPPETPDETCPPTDKSGCGTRKLKDGLGYLQDVSGVGKPLEFLGTDFGNAFSAGDCEHGGFDDFGRIQGADLPKLYPGVPSAKRLAQRHKTFTVTVHRKDRGNHGADVQSRTVSVTFKRLP